MNYELAKKLKAAGFPKDITLPDTQEAIIDGEEGFATPLADYPTLSELIEACGESIEHIDFLHDMNKVIAYGVSGIKGEGVSSEEAVAMLYLALHEKK